jgi:hypothetical protein
MYNIGIYTYIVDFAAIHVDGRQQNLGIRSANH